MIQNFQKFGIIGGGAWGTALALSLIRAGRDVVLWARDADVVASINQRHENARRLPGVTLDARLKATGNLADLAGCNAWVFAAPAQHARELYRKLKEVAKDSRAPIIIAAKGIEQKTSSLMAAVAAAELPMHPVAIISGPSFAVEVARGLPTALTLAASDGKLGEALLQAMASPAFRLYLTDDVQGVQIGGAVKNVLAIACGIVTGRNMGENARAALLTRGLAELVRLGVATGARAETMMGLSGLGDLVLTCSSTQSRNMALGLALGRGQSLADVTTSHSGIAEGVATASAALALAKAYKVDMPIVAAVDAVISGGADISEIAASLLSRPLKSEKT